MESPNAQPDNFKKDMTIVFGLIAGVFIVFLLLLSVGAMTLKSKIAKFSTFEFSNMPKDSIDSNKEPSTTKPNKLKPVPNTIINPQINTDPDYNPEGNCTYKSIEIDGDISRLCYNATDLNTLNTVLYQRRFSLSRISQTKSLIEQNCLPQYEAERTLVEQRVCDEYEITLDTHTKLVEQQQNIINSIKERGKP